MANTRKQTVTEADLLEDGRIRGYMKTEWPDDDTGEIDPEDTYKVSKTFADFASCPARLQDFIREKTGLT